MNRTEKPLCSPGGRVVVEGIRSLRVLQKGQGSEGSKAESVKDRGWKGPLRRWRLTRAVNKEKKAACKGLKGQCSRCKGEVTGIRACLGIGLAHGAEGQGVARRVQG